MPNNLNTTPQSMSMDINRQPLPLPPLLTLPLELRQQIYSYLLNQEEISHPLPSVGITSVSHRPPTAAVLNVHPQIADEILDYFYSIASWKLIFSHAFNFFRVDPELKHLERSPSLRQLRKVEVVFYCDILLLREYPSFGLDKFCGEIRRRAERACDVLVQAINLRSVTVSWIDTTCTGGWRQKARILEPLCKLKRDGLTFCVGDINGPADLDRRTFVQTMRNILGHPIISDYAPQYTDNPSRVRMLAFDVRQDRHMFDQVKSLRDGHAEAFSTAGWPELEPPLI